ncbi:hypothetical protein GCM10023336_05750 [Streptomyces similanensis]|uniref:Uncharacterized protein n=1 Tax=Streptomyces similanensis TaxID=1274988 RepID=A0ABP9JT06_9ACTN
MNEDDCFPLLLSQRERSAIELAFQWATSKAVAAEIQSRHELSDDDFLAGFPDLAEAVQELPDEDPPDDPPDV